MATYCFVGESADNNGIPYGEFGAGVYRRRVDLPYLIAHPEKLALATAPNSPLTSFSGFVQNDVLELFQVPIGYLPMLAAVRVNTVEGATAAAEIGISDDFVGATADADGLMESVDLNAAASEVSEGTSTVPPATILDGAQPKIAITEGAAITMTFTTNDTYAVAIFDVAIFGAMLLPENMER